MPAWSGLFNGVYKENHALQFQRNANERNLSLILRKAGQQRMKELLLTLVAGAVGDPALASQTRITHDAGGPGDTMLQSGVIPIETETFINRNTTNADVTDLTAIINAGPAIALVKDKGGSSIIGDPRYVN